MTDKINKIKKVKQKYERRWLVFEEVVAVGIGITSKGENGIIVSVKKKSPAIQKEIPDKIKNLPIEIQETGEIKAY